MAHDTLKALAATPEGALDLERGIATPEAAQILGVSPITLEQMRPRGDGPPFFRCGRRVRYRLGSVIAWRDARTVGRAP